MQINSDHMALSQKPRIAVVGTGVIGLSVSLCLTETYRQQLDLTIIANKFSPDTTSDCAGGLILPGGNYYWMEAACLRRIQRSG